MSWCTLMLRYGSVYLLNFLSVNAAGSVKGPAYVVSFLPVAFWQILRKTYKGGKRNRIILHFFHPRSVFSVFIAIWFFWLCVLFSNTILRPLTRQHFLHSPSSLLVMHRVNWNSLKITGHRCTPPWFRKKTQQPTIPLLEFMSESSLCTKVMLQASLCLA